MDIKNIENKIILIREQKVLLDTDVAEIYACPELVEGE